MKVPEKTLWKNWADALRQEMMTGLTPEVTKSLEDIASETATTKAEKSLQSVRFWRACQVGDSPNDFLARAGFEIDFQSEDEKTVQEVTLRLNFSWMTIMDRVIARRTK